jgi:hypothetical protein
MVAWRRSEGGVRMDAHGSVCLSVGELSSYGEIDLIGLPELQEGIRRISSALVSSSAVETQIAAHVLKTNHNSTLFNFLNYKNHFT